MPDLGILIVEPLHPRVDVQVAEAAAELHLGLEIHRLIAKEDHAVLDQSRLDLGNLLVADRFGQIDAADFTADVRREAFDRDGPACR